MVLNYCFVVVCVIILVSIIRVSSGLLLLSLVSQSSCSRMLCDFVAFLVECSSVHCVCV